MVDQPVPPSRRDKVLAVLREADGPLFTSTIAARAQLEQRSTSQALNILLKEGVVQRSKSGGPMAKEGSKERRWRLRPLDQG